MQNAENWILRNGESIEIEIVERGKNLSRDLLMSSYILISPRPLKLRYCVEGIEWSKGSLPGERGRDLTEKHIKRPPVEMWHGRKSKYGKKEGRKKMFETSRVKNPPSLLLGRLL